MELDGLKCKQGVGRVAPSSPSLLRQQQSLDLIVKLNNPIKLSARPCTRLADFANMSLSPKFVLGRLAGRCVPPRVSITVILRSQYAPTSDLQRHRHKASRLLGLVHKDIHIVFKGLFPDSSCRCVDELSLRVGLSDALEAIFPRRASRGRRMGPRTPDSSQRGHAKGCLFTLLSTPLWESWRFAFSWRMRSHAP